MNGSSAEDGAWHEVNLVRCRSRRDFLAMVTSDEYQTLHEHREGGIAYAQVAPTQAGINLVTPRLVVFGLLLLLAYGTDRLLAKLSAK